MDTCFLYSKYLNEAGCLALKLSAEGVLRAPLKQYTFTELKELQQESKTIIVESCTSASILMLELPWLPERKARAAIPYALEDQLAQPVEELHFAFDKLRYKNKHYKISVISKQRLRSLMQQLEQQSLDFELITLDWFALEQQQQCISEATLLINQDDFQGTLSGALAYSYLKKHPQQQTLSFQDSDIKLVLDDNTIKNPEHSYVWIAQKLLKTTPLNLCQGDMQHGNTSARVKRGYQLIGALCALWLLSILLVNAIQLHSLNQQTEQVDQKIATIYHQFFPEAKQVISPKFRINQLLGSNDTNSQNKFWSLLNELAKALQKSPINLEQLRYQNKTLSMTVVSPDFAHLEDLENTLKKAALTVHQTEASSHDQQVIATLELT